MRTSRLALIGFGNVGQGFVQILHERAGVLAERFGVEFRIVAVCDILKGSVYDPKGLEPGTLLEAVQAGDLTTVPGAATDWDAETTIARSGADTVVEISYTDLVTGEPAISHVRAALAAGQHVVTTNKGPIALCYPELRALADARGVQIGFEGTVMSGTPALRLGSELLAAAGLRRVQSVPNGTANYILTRMEAGSDYASALAEAQEKGYAEADPTGDVEGYDAAGKVVILSNLLLGASLTLHDVKREGITELTIEDIKAARESGRCWKLLGTAERQSGGVVASVQPMQVPMAHPLANVSGAMNAITYTTDVLQDVTLIGPGAGRQQTGYALLTDLLAIHR